MDYIKMNIKKTITSSYERILLHRLSLSKIKNNGIISLHKKNTTNVGDKMCAPYLYFKELEDLGVEDISNYLSADVIAMNKWFFNVKNNSIILGGGGLLDRKSFHYPVSFLSSLVDRGKKIVLWGVGHNNPLLKPSAVFYQQIKQFKLVGIRDYNIPNTEWVPCPSCLNNKFDTEFKIKKEVGLIIHHHIPISLIDEVSILKNEASVLKNDAKFEDVIRFIGEHEYIVTNSYHAMYWSMLMSRKVVVIPNSSKMFSFKYNAPYCMDLSNIRDYFKHTTIYDGLLEECRDINVNYSQKVFNYLNI